MSRFILYSLDLLLTWKFSKIWIESLFELSIWRGSGQKRRWCVCGQALFSPLTNHTSVWTQRLWCPERKRLFLFTKRVANRHLKGCKPQMDRGHSFLTWWPKLTWVSSVFYVFIRPRGLLGQTLGAAWAVRFFPAFHKKMVCIAKWFGTRWVGPQTGHWWLNLRFADVLPIQRSSKSLTIANLRVTLFIYLLWVTLFIESFCVWIFPENMSW